MYYAYIRVSTDHQHVENQKHEINTFTQKQGIQISKWVDETISSRKPLQERKLGKLLKKLKKGDVLIATELSRLGRNLLEVMGILQNCLEKDCQIWTLKENYRLGADTVSYTHLDVYKRQGMSIRLNMCSSLYQIIVPLNV